MRLASNSEPRRWGSWSSCCPNCSESCPASCCPERCQNCLPGCSTGCSPSCCPRYSIHCSARCSSGCSSRCGLSSSAGCCPHCSPSSSGRSSPDCSESCFPSCSSRCCPDCRGNNDSRRTTERISPRPTLNTAFDSTRSTPASRHAATGSARPHRADSDSLDGRRVQPYAQSVWRTH